MLKINYSANHSTNSPSHFGLKDRKAASQRDGTAMKLLHFSPGFIPGKVEAKLGREHVKPGHVFKSAHLESPMLPAFDPYAPLPSEAAVDETLEKLQVLREEVGDIAKEEYQQCYVNIFNRNPPAGLELSKLKSFPSMKSTVNMATYFTYQDKVHETENKLCCQVLYNCYFMIPKSSEMAGLIKKKFALHIRNLPSSKCKDFIEKICSHAKNEMNKEFPMLFVQPNMTQYLDAFSPLLKLEDLLSKKEKEKLQAKSDLTHLCLLHQQILLPMIDKALIYSNLDLKNNTPISPSHIISFLTLAEVGGNNNESSTGSLLNEDEKMPALQDLEMPALNEPSRSDYDYKNVSDIEIYDVEVKKQYVPVYCKVATPTMNISDILNSKNSLKDASLKRKADQQEKKEARNKKKKVSRAVSGVKNGSAAASVVCGSCDLKIFQIKLSRITKVM